MRSEVFLPVDLAGHSRVEARDDLLEVKTRLRDALEWDDGKHVKFSIREDLDVVGVCLTLFTYLMTVEGHPT